ncbi:MAG: hypothetical protein GIX03_12765 [Candidatus Eremiobacteraeota bacterium]|nr:hypothetical protein [Candidatus Eremiobacteraeota bacterium]MBC5803838.1 hypothetical protein [Candidatus Eremiobacteraeota bacterium]MBC5821772.1 hypothetical protein [Candidatus Eremiobacteraeota bacterium]
MGLSSTTRLSLEPWLRSADVGRFLKLCEDLGQTQTIAAWQAWLRENAG